MTTAHVDLDRREMFAEIKKLCVPNNVTNWFVLLGEYAIFATTAGLCLAAYSAIDARGLSLWWMAPIYLMTVFVIGAWTQNRLGVLIHESSHYSLFKNRVLNDVMANLFVAFPIFAVISNYRVGHWGHHRNVNDPKNDPDLKRLIKHHWRNFPITRWRFCWEYLLLQVMPHKAFSYLKGRAEYVALQMAGADKVKDRDALGKPLLATLRIGFYLTLITGLTYFGWWTQYLLLWMVPMVTFYPAVLFLREIAHHGNYPDNGDFTNSRVYTGKWLEQAIFFPYGEHNHVLHHMFPTIPWYRVPDAQATMMRYPPYRENVVICNGFFFKGDPTSKNPTVLDILSKPSHAYLRRDDAHTTPSGTMQPGAIRGEMVSTVGAIVPKDATWHRGES